jgi:prophage regulatory protein
MRLLSSKDLRAKGIEISRAQLYRLMKRGRFPRPIKVSTNRNFWIESEIDGFIQQRIEERDRGAA